MSYKVHLIIPTNIACFASAAEDQLVELYNRGVRLADINVPNILVTIKDKVNHFKKDTYYNILQQLMVENHEITAIPRKIHFIWVGSALPSKFSDNVINWAEYTRGSEHDPGYQVYLWTDEGTLENKAICERLVGHGVRLNHWKSIGESNAIPENVFKLLEDTIEEGHKEGHSPNYCSDIHRIALLYKEGGLYIDTDNFILNGSQKPLIVPKQFHG
jgi:hypothetical protein